MAAPETLTRTQGVPTRNLPLHAVGKGDDNVHSDTHFGVDQQAQHTMSMLATRGNRCASTHLRLAAQLAHLLHLLPDFSCLCLPLLLPLQGLGQGSPAVLISHLRLKLLAGTLLHRDHTCTCTSVSSQGELVATLVCCLRLVTGVLTAAVVSSCVVPEPFLG